MKVGIVGGGINGVMTAIACAKAGYEVHLFERNTLMSATSSASTKLLHGGLRYLENKEFRLVRESLRERAWWLANAPHLAQPVRLFVPIVTGRSRPSWHIRAGLLLYDLLAGRRNIGRHHAYTRSEFREAVAGLKTRDLCGGFHFYDVQMDDYGLGLWAARRAEAAGVTIVEHAPVLTVDPNGLLTTTTQQAQFDCIVNAAGPWAEALLVASRVPSRSHLDLVRGSHVIIDRPLRHGYVLQHPADKRICFALPWKGQTLVGTTEVRQSLSEPIFCSRSELDYLLSLYNTYFDDPVGSGDIVSTFAGLRPLLRSHGDPTKASREYALERIGRLVTVFGGKWTTSRALGEKVAAAVRRCAST